MAVYEYDYSICVHLSGVHLQIMEMGTRLARQVRDTIFGTSNSFGPILQPALGNIDNSIIYRVSASPDQYQKIAGYPSEIFPAI